MRNLTHTRR